MTAFDALYRRHAPSVRRLAIDASRTAQQADDVVQQTFVRALEQVGSLRDPSRVRPWLYAIARNAACDEHRFSARVELASDPADEVADAASVEQTAEGRELGRALAAALKTMSDRDARAVALAAQFGSNTVEIGTALGIKPVAAKVAVHRARRRLREAVGLA